jgi:predicted kinase
MAIIHMICGPVGAGKTTYAISLADELGAIRFSLDDWISELFFPDKPDPLTYEWAVERVKRCEARILAVSWSVLERGTDVIWDMGFMERDQRDRIIGAAMDSPHAVRLHILDAPADVRRARVRRRNLEKPDGYVMDVSDEMFDFMERRSVPVSSEEAPDVIHIDTAPDGNT